MPYKSQQDLPQQVKDHLPARAQSIYKGVFNSAYEEYRDPQKRRGEETREEVSHKVAWSAVKQEYEKGEDGNWKRKS